MEREKREREMVEERKREEERDESVTGRSERCMFIHSGLINYPATLQQEIEKQALIVLHGSRRADYQGDENTTIASGKKNPSLTKEKSNYTYSPWLFHETEKENISLPHADECKKAIIVA